MKSEEELRLCGYFGKNLAFIRRTVSWSQEKLALESGLTRGHISDIESGRRGISIVTIFRLADALGINASELLNFERK